MATNAETSTLVSSSSALVIGFADSRALAMEIAQILGLAYEEVETHRFPDGESLVRLQAAPPRAIIVRSLDRPNDKLVELHLLADNLRRRGARSLTLVAPYMAYMRQDMAFRPGEAVSQEIIGRWLAGLFDRIVCMDPHLHRTPTLGPIFPGIRADSVSAAPLLGAWVAEISVPTPEVPLVTLGPDEEAEPLIAQAAEGAQAWLRRVRGLDEATAARSILSACGRKVRRGDRDVSITLPATPSVQGCKVALIDDVISSGGTMMELARLARLAGAVSIVAAATHALFPPENLAAFTKAGIERMGSVSTVAHPVHAISAAPLLAQCLRAGPF
jgi:ribose-phosphate pyrophosphokinase